MKILLSIIVLILNFACNSNNYVKNKTEIVAKGIKNIEDTNFVVPKGLLIGKWKESIRWEKHDSTWTGMKSLNLIHEYEFFKNGKIVQREIDIEDSNVAWTSWLGGNLNKSRNTLYLFKNQRNDTVFKAAGWLLGYLMLAKAMTKTYIISEIAFGLLYYFLTVVFVNKYGVIGVTYSYCLNAAIYLITMLVIFSKLMFKRN